jgi:class 3 adenylate cyclase
MEMLIIVRRFSHDRRFQLNIRIGIHSGNVVAGIVGKSKYIYDVWGDTVDHCQSLMSSCPIGAILVSSEVYHRLEDIYEFQALESINSKNWLLSNIQNDMRRT